MNAPRFRSHASQVDTALAFLSGGEGARAESILRRVLAEDPNHAGAWHGLACVARQAGQPRVAISAVAQALQLVRDESEKARFHLTLAAALDEAGHLCEAIAACNVALLIQPKDFRVQALLAELFHRSGQEAEANQALSSAVALAADPVPVLACHGAFLMKQRAFASACTVFTQLVQHAPDRAEAHANLGAALFEIGAMSQALAALDKALSLAKPSPATLSNLGLVCQALGALDDAQAAFDKAVELAPEDTGIAMNRATLWAETGREREAEAYFESLHAEGARASVGEQRLHQARFNLATLQLARGDYEHGWPNFEHRLALRGAALAARAWQGEATEARVLIEGEQGLGDCLQFLRFVPSAAQYAPLLLRLPEPVMPLLAYMPSLTPLLESGRVTLEGEAVLSCALLSLPSVLGIKQIDPAPIFDFGVQREKGRVGLFRAGNPAYRFDARRSIPASFLEPLRQVPGVTLLNLQEGDGEGSDGLLGMEQGVGATLLDTAREMARCDIVIGVDTMLAHLAGAGGTELWLMDRLGGDWRWLGPDWYARTRIFRPDDRQMPEKAWPAVIRRVASALRDRYQPAG